MFRVFLLSGGLVLGLAMTASAVDVGDVVEGAYRRDRLVRAEIVDLTMEAVSLSRKLTGDGSVKEEKKFLKTYYFKDSLFATSFHEYYLDGVKQDEKKLIEQVREDEQRRSKGRGRDASIDPLAPFSPKNRQNYRFTLLDDESRQGADCYHVNAECLVEDENLLEGDFWFDREGFNLVYAEVHPAELTSPLKQLDMVQSRKRHESGYWLPDRFYLRGRGKVMLVIKFAFEVEEKYSNHRLNGGLSDELFKEKGDED